MTLNYYGIMLSVLTMIIYVVIDVFFIDNTTNLVTRAVVLVFGFVIFLLSINPESEEKTQQNSPVNKNALQSFSSESVMK